MVLFDILVESLNQRLGQTAHFLREDVPKKTAVLLDFVQITSPPSPQFGQLAQLCLNAKNLDLSDIRNDSLSKILLN